jgi:hypothetical protein
VWGVWEKRKMRKGIISGKLKERDNLEDLGADLNIILKWILKKEDWRLSVDYCSRGYGQVTCHCDKDYEPSGFIKCKEILGCLKKYH